MEKRTQCNVGHLIVAIVGMLWMHSLWVQMRTVQPISDCEFQTS